MIAHNSFFTVEKLDGQLLGGVFTATTYHANISSSPRYSGTVYQKADHKSSINHDVKTTDGCFMRTLEEIEASFRDVLRSALQSGNSQALLALMAELRAFDADDARALHAHAEMTCLRIEQNYPAAKEAGKGALALYLTLGKHEAVHNIRMSLAWIHLKQGEMYEALALYEPLYDDCVKRNDPNGSAAAACNLGMVYKSMGDYSKALAYLEIARELLVELGDLGRQALAIGLTGQVKRALGDPEGAMECYERARTLYRETGDVGREVDVTLHIGILFMTRGEYVPALDCFEHAYDLSVQIGDRNRQADAFVRIGYVYQLLRDVAHALEYYERALEMFVAIGDRLGESEVLRGIGELFTDSGDLVRAEEYLSRSISLSKELGIVRTHDVAQASYCRLKIRQGDYEAAENILKQLDQ